MEYRAVDEGRRARGVRRRRADVPAAAAEELSGAGDAAAEAGRAGDAAEEPVGVGGPGERQSRRGGELRDGPGGAWWRWRERQSNQKVPLVRFLTGDSEQLQTVGQKEFTVELGGKVVARRLQLPLKLVGTGEGSEVGVGHQHPQVAGDDDRPAGRGPEGCVRGGNDVRGAEQRRVARPDVSPQLFDPRRDDEPEVASGAGWDVE